VNLLDVNVLVYAHRQDAADHAAYREWLTKVIASEEAFGVPDMVLSGFVRVVTHPRIFKTPSTIEQALAFVADVRDAPNALRVEPGPRHWEIFERLCRETPARGNLVADAFLAAFAIEAGCEWVTTDGDYVRFKGLRSRHPLRARDA
jgi:toxin-antitoxin system PIN domain toxin